MCERLQETQTSFLFGCESELIRKPETSPQLGMFETSTMARVTLLLALIGRCAGQRVVSESSVHAELGGRVTLETPIHDLQNSALFWHFNDGKEIVNVASVSSSTLTLNTSYEGRAWIDAANGHLTLGTLTLQDSGEYIITIISKQGQGDVAKIRLTVSAPPTRTSPTPALPEQITDYFVSLVVCVGVIVMLSAGFLLLLYRWMENRKDGASDGGQVELSALQQRKGAPGATCEDSTYESMTPAPTDQDHIYSTLADTRHTLCSCSAHHGMIFDSHEQNK